jgi:HTH-type transcriptional regulator/antitoxin HigA
MTIRRPAEVFPPGHYIKDELEERGWTQADLAEIMGRQSTSINDLVKGKCGITVETAVGLASAFGSSPELWMKLDQAYKLHRLASYQDNAVARRARLYNYTPVSEMIKRGWIEPSDNIDILEQQILSFYSIKNFDEKPKLYDVALRKSTSYDDDLTSGQKAWFTRSAQISKSVSVNRFSETSLKTALENIKLLLHEPLEIRHVPRILSEAGIRFVIVQAFSGSKIDGACFWLNDTSPVISLSMRFDRIDYFWFTLLHELGHCFDRETSIDVEQEEVNFVKGKPSKEKKADEFAVSALLEPKALNNFIARKRPLYSVKNIEAFAHTMHVHPGIVVGQLQKKGEVNWTHFRKLLVPVRKLIIDSALTDGWDRIVPASYIE